jgi:regulator of RNase E activity RraB
MEQELGYWLEHTEQLVNELIEDGSNEEEHHTIEHHFASVDFDLLEKAAVTAFKMGWEVEEPEEAELENGERIFAFDVITEQPLELEILAQETKQMYEFAQNNNVEYDGWGTYFEE